MDKNIKIQLLKNFPLSYEVTVCPNCAYSFTGFKPEKLGNKSLKLLKPVLEQLLKKKFLLHSEYRYGYRNFYLCINLPGSASSKEIKNCFTQLKISLVA